MHVHRLRIACFNQLKVSADHAEGGGFGETPRHDSKTFLCRLKRVKAAWCSEAFLAWSMPCGPSTLSSLASHAPKEHLLRRIKALVDEVLGGIALILLRGILGSMSSVNAAGTTAQVHGAGCPHPILRRKPPDSSAALRPAMPSVLRLHSPRPSGRSQRLQHEPGRPVMAGTGSDRAPCGREHRCERTAWSVGRSEPIPCGNP